MHYYANSKEPSPTVPEASSSNVDAETKQTEEKKVEPAVNSDDGSIGGDSKDDQKQGEAEGEKIIDRSDQTEAGKSSGEAVQTESNDSSSATETDLIGELKIWFPKIIRRSNKVRLDHNGSTQCYCPSLWWRIPL